MEIISRNEQFNESWFSGFRSIIEKSFIKPNHKVNALMILQKVESHDVNKEKIISTIQNLSEEEWSESYVMSKLKEMDESLGFDDDFLRKHAVNDLSKDDLLEVKWEMSKRMMLDYAKFSKEFYDSLKYSKNNNISREDYLLMIEVMNALKIIQEGSKSLTDKFTHKKYNKRSFAKFMKHRIPIEHLLLRTYYILLNIEKSNKIKLRDVLSKEILEYTVHQKNDF